MAVPGAGPIVAPAAIFLVAPAQQGIRVERSCQFVKRGGGSSAAAFGDVLVAIALLAGGLVGLVAAGAISACRWCCSPRALASAPGWFTDYRRRESQSKARRAPRLGRL
jgi:hypothetical protein